ncbi:MAG: glycosyltransferase [Chloroflexota bacterium]
MFNPKVDIIIPAYNQGHYLKASVDSALSQTWQNLEVIIVDDGSTDNTAAVAKSFTDSRVTYIYQENAGLSAARNTGLRNMTGEYVSFLDSDDLFFPKKLDILLKQFEKKSNLGMCAGNSVLINEEGEPIGKTYGMGMPDKPEEWLLGNRIHVGSAVVKSEWIKRVEPFDESLRACEDWDMWLRLSAAGCEMAWVADSVSMYRVHSQQMTRETTRMKTAMFAVLGKILDGPLEPEWLEMATKAKSAALIKSAARAFLSGDTDMATQDIAQAVQISPDLKAKQGADLLETLKGWAYSPSSPDPLQYMVSVFDHLPSELQIPTSVRKNELGSLAVNLAFENYLEGKPSLVRKYFIEAVKIDPSKIVNRKLCSIFVQSLFPRAA